MSEEELMDFIMKNENKFAVLEFVSINNQEVFDVTKVFTKVGNISIVKEYNENKKEKFIFVEVGNFCARLDNLKSVTIKQRALKL